MKGTERREWNSLFVYEEKGWNDISWALPLTLCVYVTDRQYGVWMLLLHVEDTDRRLVYNLPAGHASCRGYRPRQTLPLLLYSLSSVARVCVCPSVCSRFIMWRACACLRRVLRSWIRRCSLSLRAVCLETNACVDWTCAPCWRKRAQMDTTTARRASASVSKPSACSQRKFA